MVLTDVRLMKKNLLVSVKMSKALIPLKFLLRLILALIIFIPLTIVACNIFRVSEQGTSSYYDLVRKIDGAAGNEGEIDSMPLYMDKKTLVLGFKKSSEEIMYSTVKENSILKFWKPSAEIANLRFTKPDECENGMACLCLCRVIEVDEMKPVPQKHTYYAQCNSRICSGVEDINFEDTEARFVNSFGFFKANEEKAGGLFLSRENWEQRLRTVYIQNEKNNISVCYSPPCVEKKQSPLPKDI